jgi:hypothetical protein
MNTTTALDTESLQQAIEDRKAILEAIKEELITRLELEVEPEDIDDDTFLFGGGLPALPAGGHGLPLPVRAFPPGRGPRSVIGPADPEPALRTRRPRGLQGALNTDFRGGKPTDNGTIDRKASLVQLGLAQDRVVAPLVELHQDAVPLHFHLTTRLDEFARGLLRGGLVEPAEMVGQPSIAPIGQHRQRHIQVDVPHDAAPRGSRRLSPYGDRQLWNG